MTVLHRSCAHIFIQVIVSVLSFFPVLPGQLEVFHNALLKYCPKHIHFEHAAMQARTMLAIMDHNENHTTQREQATAAAGKT